MIILVVLAALVAMAAWLGVRGWLAKGELEQLQAIKPALSQAISAHDTGALSAALDDAHAHAARAADLTGDPLWRATEGLPVVGANTAAVRVAAESLRDVSGAALPLAGELTNVGGDADAAGGIDLSGLGRLAAPLRAAADAAADAQTRLGALDTGALLAPLCSGITDLDQLVTSVVPLLDQAVRAVTVVPTMLGSEGDRTILVMVQNPAEARTGGGITGSFISLLASAGHLRLGDHATSSDFARGAVSATFPEEITALYGADVGDFVMNVTVTPDFDTSAHFARAWWQTLGKAAPDAVISIDPAVLAALLRIAGPLTLSDGTSVDAGTVTETILVRPYLALTTDGQTAIQSDLIERLFTRLLATPFDPTAWAGALAESVSEGRVSIWSAHPDEQAVLADSPFAGTLARYRAAGDDAIGVYFNDATTGKMDTFLDAAIGVSSRVCRADGVAEVDVAVTLHNTATDASRGYPPSMAGGANPALPGDITTDVTVAVPTGWFFGGVTSAGATVASTDIDITAPASVSRVQLTPGQQSTTVFRFYAGDGGESPEPTIVHTPMMNPIRVEQSPAQACG